MDFFLVIHTKFQCYEIRFDRLLIIDFFFFWFYSVIVYVWYWIEFIYSHIQKLMNPCEIWILGIHCVCVCVCSFFLLIIIIFNGYLSDDNNNNNKCFFLVNVCVCVLSMVTTNFFFIHWTFINPHPSFGVWCVCAFVCRIFFLLLHFTIFIFNR